MTTLTFYISIIINNNSAQLYFTKDIKDNIHKLSYVECNNLNYDTFEANNYTIICKSSIFPEYGNISFDISDIDDKVITTVKIKLS